MLISVFNGKCEALTGAIIGSIKMYSKIMTQNLDELVRFHFQKFILRLCRTEWNLAPITKVSPIFIGLILVITPILVL